MSRIGGIFERLARQRRKALIPFITAGDPAAGATVPVMYALAQAGADVIELGVSPRASLGMLAAGRALALLRGRSYVLPGDIAEIASDVMSHRMLLSFDAVADGADPRGIVREILTKVPQPSLASREERPLGPRPSSPPPSAPPAPSPATPTMSEEHDRAPLGEPTRP